MAWLFRWLRALLDRLPGRTGESADWVEPSNSVTRAVLGGEVALPVIAGPEQGSGQRQPGRIIALPQRSQPASRTAQRTRRRRASRAA